MGMMNQTSLFPATSAQDVHVFEQAGLGKAPYVYLGVQPLRGPIDLGGGTWIGAPGQPMGACQFCNTPIAYLFWLESADGKKFYVGSDCIHRSGDIGLQRVVAPEVARHNAEIRDARSHALIATFEDYLLTHPSFWTDDNRPHPLAYRARLGETMGIHNRGEYYRAGRNGRTLDKKAALARTFLLFARVALPPIAAARVKKSHTCVYLKRTHDKCKTCGRSKPLPVEHTIVGMYGGIKIIDLGD